MSVETIEFEWRTARKDHVCTYCERTIKSGERYVYYTNIDHGSWFHGKVHDECNSAYQWFGEWDWAVDPGEWRSHHLPEYRDRCCDRGAYAKCDCDRRMG